MTGADVAALLGFVAIPLLLVSWMILECIWAVVNARRHQRVGNVVALVDEILAAMQVPASVEVAQIKADSLQRIAIEKKAPLWLQVFAPQLSAPIQLALHAESHGRDVAADAEYVGRLADLIKKGRSAIEREDQLDLARVIGEIYTMAFTDLNLMVRTEVSRDEMPDWVVDNNADPCLLLSRILTQAADSLDQGSTLDAKLLVWYALEKMPSMIRPGRLPISLFALSWAKAGLIDLSQPESYVLSPLTSSPEVALATRLRAVAAAASKKDKRRLVRVIASCGDV